MSEREDKGKIAVLIADSYRVSQEELRHLLIKSPTCQLVGLATNCTEMLEMSKKLNPDICLLNLSSLSRMAWAELVSSLINAVPTTRPISVGTPLDLSILQRLLHAGVWGYIQPFAPLKHILKAITVVHRGELWMERKVMESLLHDGSYPINVSEQLTNRELELYCMVCKGFSNREIAETLYISEKTVRSHLSHLYDKTGAKTRSQLIVRGLRFKK